MMQFLLLTLYLCFVSCTIHLSRGWRWSAAPQPIIKQLGAEDAFQSEQRWSRRRGAVMDGGCSRACLASIPHLPHMDGAGGGVVAPPAPSEPPAHSLQGKGDEWDGASPARGAQLLVPLAAAGAGTNICRGQGLQWASPEMAKKATCKGQCLQ